MFLEILDKVPGVLDLATNIVGGGFLGGTLALLGLKASKVKKAGA